MAGNRWSGGVRLHGVSLSRGLNKGGERLKKIWIVATLRDNVNDCDRTAPERVARRQL
jgi:hypothetical protein